MVVVSLLLLLVVVVVMMMEVLYCILYILYMEKSFVHLLVVCYLECPWVFVTVAGACTSNCVSV